MYELSMWEMSFATEHVHSMCQQFRTDFRSLHCMLTEFMPQMQHECFQMYFVCLSHHSSYRWKMCSLWWWKLCRLSSECTHLPLMRRRQHCGSQQRTLLSMSRELCHLRSHRISQMQIVFFHNVPKCSAMPRVSRRVRLLHKWHSLFVVQSCALLSQQFLPSVSQKLHCVRTRFVSERSEVQWMCKWEIRNRHQLTAADLQRSLWGLLDRNLRMRQCKRCSLWRMW